MMSINFDTIANNNEVIYVIKTDKILLTKIDTSFHQRSLSASSEFGSTFIC